MTTFLLFVVTKTTTTLEVEVEVAHKGADTMVEANLEAVAVAEVTLVAMAEAVVDVVSKNSILNALLRQAFGKVVILGSTRILSQSLRKLNTMKT